MSFTYECLSTCLSCEWGAVYNSRVAGSHPNFDFDIRSGSELYSKLSAEDCSLFNPRVLKTTVHVHFFGKSRKCPVRLHLFLHWYWGGTCTLDDDG